MYSIPAHLAPILCGRRSYGQRMTGRVVNHLLAMRQGRAVTWLERVLGGVA